MFSQRIRPGLSATVCLLLCSLHLPAGAVDSASLEWGTGNKTRMARVGLQWNWNAEWLKTEHSRLTGYWDLTFSRWQGRRFRDVPGARQYITDVGITPVLRLEGASGRGLYGEVGVGAHWLSELYDNNDRQLSTRFEFGDHLGIGYAFQNGLDIALKYQHFSNGGIKNPNDGVNFAVVRIMYRF
ncbi:acyloxyacyl hydrolase [Noviherbaspirillum massiliense]|uniref:acyloxyacyl hydrolase n=1 Tax=Noviherbaspirillum massiliense TaxID=1465823 RepID=UPI0005525A12|nr:acyloxyacyl hydrolase [Noviherbaspirillum massiliense]